MLIILKISEKSVLFYNKISPGLDFTFIELENIKSLSYKYLILPSNKILLFPKNIKVDSGSNKRIFLTVISPKTIYLFNTNHDIFFILEYLIDARFILISEINTLQFLLKDFEYSLSVKIINSALLKRQIFPLSCNDTSTDL